MNTCQLCKEHYIDYHLCINKDTGSKSIILDGIHADECSLCTRKFEVDTGYCHNCKEFVK